MSPTTNRPMRDWIIDPGAVLIVAREQSECGRCGQRGGGWASLPCAADATLWFLSDACGRCGVRFTSILQISDDA